MKRFNLLFSFAFFFSMAFNANAQTVSIVGADWLSDYEITAGFLGSFCGANNSGWGVGDSVVTNLQTPFILSFSEPVTSFTLPAAGWYLMYLYIDVLGGDEIVTSATCPDDVTVIGPTQTGTQIVLSNQGAGGGTANQSGELTISSSTPFTTVTIEVSGGGFPATQYLSIPKANFLNNWSGFINQTDTDGDGVADADDNCPGTASGTTVDAQGCPDTDGDAVVGLADPDGSDPCNPDPNDAACNSSNCNAGTAAPQFGN
ncbi:MAG: hypothetical protein NXI25_24045 [bacterium]|nr:hypothetical protein [bacterium]